jgi:hypothetical protein
MSDATTQPLKPFKAHLNLSFQGLDAACAGKQIRDGLEALEELGFVVETMMFGEPSLFDARDGASEGHSPGPAADAPSRASGTEQVHLPAVLAEAFGVSRSEARRLINQGAVRANRGAGDRFQLKDWDLPASLIDGAVVTLGKDRSKRVDLTALAVSK